MSKVYNDSAYTAFTSERNFDLAKHSSIGCGGRAEIVFYPKSVAELTALLNKLQADGIAYRVIGNMTNLLPLDGGTQRALVHLKYLNGVFCNNGIFAYAGATSGSFLRACKAANLSGGEFLYGIPCTMGGALYMNAGAGGKYLAEIVESVLVYRKGESRLLTLAECEYAYKSSVFMRNGDVIIGASFRLKPSNGDEIARESARYAQRRAHLPRGKSMGCVFKNPSGVFAGDLIERCGLKGYKIGGAVISEQHANFIINDSGATAKDVCALIEKIKDVVRKQFGIDLQEEIEYLD